MKKNPEIVLKPCLYCGKSDALQVEEAAICFECDCGMGEDPNGMYIKIDDVENMLVSIMETDNNS